MSSQFKQRIDSASFKADKERSCQMDIKVNATPIYSSSNAMVKRLKSFSGMGRGGEDRKKGK
jgi:hypothetical protein